MEMYPLNFDKSKAPSLQSRLFGHRMKQSQTKYEYLIEFLQVAIAPKLNLKTEKTYTCMFPVDPAGMRMAYPISGDWDVAEAFCVFAEKQAGRKGGGG